MGKESQDSNLVAQCIKGKSSSWRELVDTFINLIYSSAYNVIAKHSHSVDKHDVEDICQVVFMNLFANNCRILRMYDEDKSKFSTWLTIITRNAAIDFIRKKKSQTISLEDAMEAMLGRNYVEPVTIDVPGGAVTPRQHLVLRMMYDDGLDVAEIAFFLGVKRQTVRSLHHRALTKLREYYGLKETHQSSLKAVNSSK